jgi:hypothetical protein
MMQMKLMMHGQKRFLVAQFEGMGRDQIKMLKNAADQGLNGENYSYKVARKTPDGHQLSRTQCVLIVEIPKGANARTEDTKIMGKVLPYMDFHAM